VNYGEAVLAVRGSGANTFLIRKPFTEKPLLLTALLVSEKGANALKACFVPLSSQKFPLPGRKSV